MTQSPFPDMDPYLEAPDLWPDVHSRLMNIIAELLAPALAPDYVAELESQVVIERIDDASDRYYIRPESYEPYEVAKPVQVRVSLDGSVRQLTVHLRNRKSGKLVTVIELFSPVNKRQGNGRKEYLEKRQGYLSSPVHFVEIDLLRMFPRMPFQNPLPPADYLIMISPWGERPDTDVWPVHIRQRLPALPIPLLDPDPPAQLDVEEALRIAYQRARYDLRIDYTKLPEPPLAEPDAEWAKMCISRHQPAL